MSQDFEFIQADETGMQPLNFNSFGALGAMLQHKIDTDPEVAEAVKKRLEGMEPKRPTPFSQAPRNARPDVKQLPEAQRELLIEAYRFAKRFGESLNCNAGCGNCMGSVRIPYLNSCLCAVFPALETGMCEQIQELKSMEATHE